MKKFLLLATALIMSAVAMNAQDLLTKNNGEDIKVIVKEIDAQNVKYVLFSEPNGVLYTMPKSEILMIRYASGRNEIFGNQRTVPTPARTTTYATPYSPYQEFDYGMADHIQVGMKYDQLKKLYDYRMYRPGGYERYSPAWSGVASFFIPGLGQLICGEAGRGFGQFALSTMCDIVTIVSIVEDVEGLALLTSLAHLGIAIWSIVDATQVAKVKNMYETDLRSMRSSVEVEMYPSLNAVPMQGGLGVAPGMTLSLTF
ncbi:MAG: hypothetical protein IJD12_06215 [Tidjanibacter sp.]|nr:hypothetical protein [Tidjanibacter sp.]